MATTPTTPAPEPITAPPPVPVTPLDPPVVVYNKKWRVPPMVVATQEALDALDPTEWTQNPPPAAAKAADPQYPKLFFNVNVPPQIINDADEEKALSSDWREFNVPESLITSSQAKIDAASK